MVTKEIQNKIFFLEMREYHIEIIQIALRMFNKTKDEVFLEHAKFFGQQSKELKARSLGFANGHPAASKT